MKSSGSETLMCLDNEVKSGCDSSLPCLKTLLFDYPNTTKKQFILRSSTKGKKTLQNLSNGTKSLYADTVGKYKNNGSSRYILALTRQSATCPC